MNKQELFRRAYDQQLRTEAETADALAVTRLGPLRLATLLGGYGFVTYQDLGDADAATIADWVGQVQRHYRRDPAITRVEWKTRGHDRAPGLSDALIAAGFRPGDPESIMIGAAAALAVDVAVPAGVSLRRVTAEADVRAMCAMQDEVFGAPPAATADQTNPSATADQAMLRLARGDGVELWVAEAAGQIVSAGRLEPVAGTEFAGIWGGATRPEWRGRGIYRALTAARARSALALGKRLVHSDSTEFSRPILQRAGLLRVGTTTPYQWRR